MPRAVSGTLAALRGYVRGAAKKGPIFLRDKAFKAQQSQRVRAQVIRAAAGTITWRGEEVSKDREYKQLGPFSKVEGTF